MVVFKVLMEAKQYAVPPSDLTAESLLALPCAAQQVMQQPVA